MIGEIILLVYVFGFLHCVWYMTGTMAWASKRSCASRPDGGDWLFAGTMAGMGALFWPICTPFCWLYNIGDGEWGARLLYTPRKYKDKLREAELQEREERVKQLEREVGIR